MMNPAAAAAAASSSFPSSASTPLISFSLSDSGNLAVELINTIGLSYIVAEMLLSNRKIYTFVPAVVGLVFVNIVWIVIWLLDLSELLPDLDVVLLTFVVAEETLPLVLLFSIPPCAAMALAKFHIRWLNDRMPWPALAGVPLTIYTLLWAFDVFPYLSAQSAWRIDVIMGIYFAFCWHDLRRFYRPIQFFRQLSFAIMFVLLVYPLLSVTAAVVMLLIANILEFIGVSVSILSALVYYGVFYGPFSAIYFVLRHGAWHNARRIATQLLPK